MTEHNEAGGVAFVDLYTPAGVKFGVTARANSPSDAIDLLVDAIKYAKDKHNITTQRTNGNGHAPTSQAVSAPTAATSPPTVKAEGQQAQADTDIIMISKLKKGMTESGKEYLKVYGGRWSKWGVKAWPEIAAQVVVLDAMTPDMDYDPPDAYTRAKVEMTDGGNPRKVLEFLP